MKECLSYVCGFLGIKNARVPKKRGDQRASTLGFRNQIWLPQSQGSSCYQIVNTNPFLHPIPNWIKPFNDPCIIFTYHSPNIWVTTLFSYNENKG